MVHLLRCKYYLQQLITPGRENKQGGEEVGNVQGEKPAKKMQRLKRKLCEQGKTSLNIGWARDILIAFAPLSHDV